MQDAHKLFDEMLERTPMSWTILMDGYAQHGPAIESLSLLCDMIIELSFVNLRPDPFIISVGLKACASFGSLDCGKELHCLAVKLGHMQDLFVANALVKVYSTCGFLRYAESVFQRISQPDLVSWSSILSGFMKNGHEAEALRLFVAMARTGIQLDSYVFSIGLKAFADQNCIALGVQVHCHMIKMGMYSSFLHNSLVEFYGRIGELASMRKVFNNMLKKDLASWNIVISCHAQSTCCKEALIYFFTLMHEGSSECNDFTLGSVLQAVTRIGATHHGKQIHGEEISWVSLVQAFGKSEEHEMTLEVFHKIQQAHGHLDHKSACFVLNCCGSPILLNAGVQAHAYITKRGLSSNPNTYNSLINMYSKCGALGHAVDAFNLLTEKNSESWTSIISAHVDHNHPF